MKQLFTIIFIISFALFITILSTGAAIRITDTMNGYHTRSLGFMNTDVNR